MGPRLNLDTFVTVALDGYILRQGIVSLNTQDEIAMFVEEEWVRSLPL